MAVSFPRQIPRSPIGELFKMHPMKCSAELVVLFASVRDHSIAGHFPCLRRLRRLTLQLEEAVAFLLGPEIGDEHQTRGGKGRSKAKDNTVL